MPRVKYGPLTEGRQRGEGYGPVDRRHRPATRIRACRLRRPRAHAARARRGGHARLPVRVGEARTQLARVGHSFVNQQACITVLEGVE